MKVSQDMRILQQLLKQAGERGDGATVNIVTIENNYNYNPDSGDYPELEAPKSRCLLPRSEIPPKQIQSLDEIDRGALFDLINTLPSPRLDTLMRSIFRVCAERDMTRQETADWIGIAYQTASTYFKRFGLKPKRGKRQSYNA